MKRNGFVYLIFSALIFLFVASCAIQSDIINEDIKTNYSILWGKSGELWDPRGRLPDYSYAGYHAGEKSIPEIQIVASVKDFGAKGDGKTDDTQAFKKAISQMPVGALLIPKGTYILSDRLVIDRSNIVLRGEGDGLDGTVLYFTKGLIEIMGYKKPWIWGRGWLVWIGEAVGRPLVETLGVVIRPAMRGDRTLEVRDTKNISAGSYVVLRLKDDLMGTLGSHLHNNQTEADGGKFRKGPLRFWWIVQVKKVNAKEIELSQPLRFDVRLNWMPLIISYHPVMEVGVEHLRIAFPDVMRPSHYGGPQSNALAFYGALNCWGKGITISRCDNGPVFHNFTKHCTLTDIKIIDRGVHHVVSFDYHSHDCMLTDFEITVEFTHDITVTNETSGNVIRRGRGKNLNFDHHTNVPFENLFTDIHVGRGTRLYESSGAMGPKSGARNTFWNIRSDNWFWKFGMPTPFWGYIQTNVIGSYRKKMTVDREWFEPIKGNIEPPDLYESQLKQRLKERINTE